jgi:hypothetical protein
MDVRTEILDQMISFAPGKFEDWQIPYILEAMQRYADFCETQHKQQKDE